MNIFDINTNEKHLLCKDMSSLFTAGFIPVTSDMIFGAPPSAFEDMGTAEQLYQDIRRDIENEEDLIVTPEGDVFNPDSPIPDGAESSMSSDGSFKPVGKFVFGTEDTSVADAIAALRDGLDDEDEEITLEPDGSVFEPDTTQPDSSLPDGSFKPVGKFVFGAESEEVDPEIVAFREALDGNGEIYMNSMGDIRVQDDPATTSSLKRSGFSPVSKHTFAAQWYEKNPALMKREIAAMRDFSSTAKLRKLNNGSLAWDVTLRPEICGKRKYYKLLGVYDRDHPQQRWGGSVKWFFVKPSYCEMAGMLNESNVTPKHIPHVLRDTETGQPYMCTQRYDEVKVGSKKDDNLINTAASGLRNAIKWIRAFEYGLIDQPTWDRFHED